MNCQCFQWFTMQKQMIPYELLMSLTIYYAETNYSLWITNVSNDLLCKKLIFPYELQMFLMIYYAKTNSSLWITNGSNDLLCRN